VQGGLVLIKVKCNDGYEVANFAEGRAGQSPFEVV